VKCDWELELGVGGKLGIVEEVEKSAVGTRLTGLYLEARDEILLNAVLFLCS
jgi:hypothetical protein